MRGRVHGGRGVRICVLLSSRDKCPMSIKVLLLEVSLLRALGGLYSPQLALHPPKTGFSRSEQQIGGSRLIPSGPCSSTPGYFSVDKVCPSHSMQGCCTPCSSLPEPDSESPSTLPFQLLSIWPLLFSVTAFPISLWSWDCGRLNSGCLSYGFPVWEDLQDDLSFKQ